jgi:hypothetical protein
MLGGLGAYFYIAANLPGTSAWLHNAGRAGVIGATLLGVFLGVAGGLIWRAWIEQSSIQRMQR